MCTGPADQRAAIQGPSRPARVRLTIAACVLLAVAVLQGFTGTPAGAQDTGVPPGPTAPTSTSTTASTTTTSSTSTTSPLPTITPPTSPTSQQTTSTTSEFPTSTSTSTSTSIFFEEETTTTVVYSPATLPRTTTTLRDLLVSGDGTAGAQSTTTSVPATVLAADAASSSETRDIWLMALGLALVAVLIGTWTFRFWAHTRPGAPVRSAHTSGPGAHERPVGSPSPHADVRAAVRFPATGHATRPVQQQPPRGPLGPRRREPLRPPLDE